MGNEQKTFAERVARIERDRRGGFFRRRRNRRPSVPGMVVHPDGVVTYRRPSQKRLRFAFPLRGVLTALFVVVAVKAFLMWVIGDEVYGAAVAQLLSGSDLERVAGLILAPDSLSLWVVDGYQAVYRFVGSMIEATPA